MTENDVRSIALFFFLALPDERLATEAAVNAVRIARDAVKRNPSLGSEKAVISATAEIWLDLKDSRSATDGADFGALNAAVNLSAWKDFVRKSSREEIVAVLWTAVLGYEPASVAEALGLAEGTIRYRLARALRKLGAAESSRPRAVSP